MYMSDLVMVVGDIVSFSTVSEYTEGAVLLESIDRVYSGLRKLLSAHRGTLSNYVGDAFFATWEAGTRGEGRRFGRTLRTRSRRHCRRNSTLIAFAGPRMGSPSAWVSVSGWAEPL